MPKRKPANDASERPTKRAAAKAARPATTEKGPFCAAPEQAAFAGLLFDMDGTLVDSTEAIIQHWHKMGKILDVDPAEILHNSHGKRSIDTLAAYNPALATWAYVKEIEGAIPYAFGRAATRVPGAQAVLARLDELGAPWAIVTSGTRPLLDGWLDVLGMARPREVVSAEDVQKGKPDPEGYLAGRRKLGLGEGDECLVVEDSPAGVRAGKNANFKVLALATTHDVARLREAGADWIVRDLRSVMVDGFEGGQVKLTIEDGLKWWLRSRGKT